MTYTAFVGTAAIAAGSLEQIFPVLKESFDRDPGTMIVTFADQTGEQVDFDLRGIAPVAPSEEIRTGPGRPKLGVVSREISLLPRHWEWLQEQPSGASAAIRRLIDEERKREPEKFVRLVATKATDRFMSAMAGNLPGYEGASRALYAADPERFRVLTAEWPHDVREYAWRLSASVFDR